MYFMLGYHVQGEKSFRKAGKQLRNIARLCSCTNPAHGLGLLGPFTLPHITAPVKTGSLVGENFCIYHLE